MKIREAFSKKEELDFLKKEQALNPPYIRWIFLLFIILYAFFAVTDLTYYPDDWQTLFIVRFAIVIPILILVILLSYKRSLSKFHQYYIAFSFFVGGAGIAYMLILYPENIIYYGGLFLVYFSGYLLVRLRFYYATFSGLAILFLYIIGHIIINNELSETVLFGLLFYIGANLIGMVGAYQLEVKNRKQFLHDREITLKNSELMDQYKKKDEQFNELMRSIEENKELMAKNKELNLLTKSLKESEERFRILHNASFGGIALHDKGLILDCNQGLSDITGFSIDELMGMDGLLLIAPDYRDFVMSKILSGYEEPYEAFGIRKNKEIYPLKLEARNIPYKGKQVRVVEFRDTTELKAKELHIKERQDMIEGMFNHMKTGVAIYTVINEGRRGKDYIIKDFNDISLKWENKTREEVVGRAISELHPNIGDSGIIEVFRKVWETGEAELFPIKQYVNGDYNRWHENRIFKLPSGEIVAMYDDVTARVEKENELKQERKDLLTSQGMAKLGTWRLDIETNNVVWSEELYKMYGFDPTKPVPPYTEHMKLFTRPSWEKLSSALAKTASKGIPYELVLETITRDGTNGWMWVRGEAEYDDQGKIVSISGAAQDITHTIQQEAEIIHASNHDYLTELPNRRYFQEMLKKYDNEVYYPLGIIIMDMNGLKLINDAFGHSVGNEVLKICANTLNETKREKDFLARIGGDEFAIICPNIKVKEIEKLVDTIDKKVSKKSIKDIELSLAIGYEIKQNKNRSIRTTLTNAENYMYRRKVLTKHTDKNDMIQSILNTLTEKYNEEKVHSNRVSKYCKAIGEVMQLRKDEIIELELAGMVHDIGKISLPDAILKKPGKLTEKEWEIIRNHTVNGYQILRAADKYSNIAEFAMSHHERMDGKGYPNGISGEEIPLFARIISVADAYEAMTSDRPYRKAMMKEEAIKELKKHAGTQFDPKIADLFIDQVLLVETT